MGNKTGRNTFPHPAAPFLLRTQQISNTQKNVNAVHQNGKTVEFRPREETTHNCIKKICTILYLSPILEAKRLIPSDLVHTYKHIYHKASWQRYNFVEIFR